MISRIHGSIQDHTAAAHHQPGRGNFGPGGSSTHIAVQGHPHDLWSVCRHLRALGCAPGGPFPCSLVTRYCKCKEGNHLSGHTAILSDALGKMFAFGPGDLHHASGATITQTVSGLPAPFVYLALHSSTSFSLSYFATPAIVHCSSRRWSGDSHVDLRRSLETDYLKRARPRVVKVSEPHRRAPSRQYVTTTTPFSLSSNHVSSRRSPAPAIHPR